MKMSCCSFPSACSVPCNMLHHKQKRSSEGSARPAQPSQPPVCPNGHLPLAWRTLALIAWISNSGLPGSRESIRSNTQNLSLSPEASLGPLPGHLNWDSGWGQRQEQEIAHLRVFPLRLQIPAWVPWNRVFLTQEQQAERQRCWKCLSQFPAQKGSGGKNQD